MEHQHHHHHHHHSQQTTTTTTTTIEKKLPTNTCLVCGRHGGNTIVVTSVHSFVSASGTPLADFLVKVVGEDPCYSVSEVICQQCFVLLDRLDAYQARAAEIHTYVTTRYRDTKLELLGQRQRMSELIAASLSNVRELTHGTTLNVSDELTITVVHEALPKNRKKLYHLQNNNNNNNRHHKHNNNNREISATDYITNKFKRRKVGIGGGGGVGGGVGGILGTPPPPQEKKKGWRGQGLAVEETRPPGIESRGERGVSTSNNNSLAYSTCVGGETDSAAARVPKRKLEETEEEEEEEEEDEEDEEARSSSDEEEEEEETVEQSEGEQGEEGVKQEEEEEEEEDEEEEEEEGRREAQPASQENENSSDDDSSSDSDDDDEEEEEEGGSGSASEEEEEEGGKTDREEQENGNEEEEEEEEEDEEEDEEEEEDSNMANKRDTSQGPQETHPPPGTRPQHPPSRKAAPPPTSPPAEEKQAGKMEANGQVQLPPEVSEGVPPQVAEAMLMQSPLATSLLQSFLATSLWFGSPDNTQKRKASSNTKQKQHHQVYVPDDVTSETLAVAAGSTKEKRQELKNTGQSYINTKGKLVDAKRVWPQDCSRCPLKCNARISEEERLKIFAEYWGLADYNLQREYLAAHMQREEKLGPSGLRRTVILYFLTSSKQSNPKLQVCRQFFLKTLDVSEKASRIVLEKMVRGELGNEGGANTPPPGPTMRHTAPHHASPPPRQAKNGEEGQQSNDEDTKSEDSS